jgi:hypothetical protein
MPGDTDNQSEAIHNASEKSHRKRTMPNPFTKLTDEDWRQAMIRGREVADARDAAIGAGIQNLFSETPPGAPALVALICSDVSRRLTTATSSPITVFSGFRVHSVTLFSAHDVATTFVRLHERMPGRSTDSARRDRSGPFHELVSPASLISIQIQLGHAGPAECVGLDSQ